MTLPCWSTLLVLSLAAAASALQLDGNSPSMLHANFEPQFDDEGLYWEFVPNLDCSICTLRSDCQQYPFSCGQCNYCRTVDCTETKTVDAFKGCVEKQDCLDTTNGESCYEEVMWARQIGIPSDPSSYPNLTVKSTIAEFQAHLYRAGNTSCPMPCGHNLPTQEELLADPHLQFPLPVVPEKPGCYLYLPSGCPRDARDHPNRSSLVTERYSSRVWNRDVSGENSFGAAYNEYACTKKRRDAYNSWCDVNDTQMAFVAGKLPKMPSDSGCHLWMPSGCDTKEDPRASRDTLYPRPMKIWSLMLENDKIKNKRHCEVIRKEYYNEVCKRSDAHTVWIPPRPREPEAPGCYLWLPLGCPNQDSSLGAQYEQWRADPKGTQGRAECYTRRRDFDNLCGTENAQTFYVPTPVELAAAANASQSLRGSQQLLAPQEREVVETGDDEQQDPFDFWGRPAKEAAVYDVE